MRAITALALVTLFGCADAPSVTDDTTPPADTDAEQDSAGPADTADTAAPGPALVAGQLVLTPSRDALLSELNPDLNYGTRIEMSGGTWTASGVPYTLRSLVAFDLISLPADATDVVAHLDLYAETTAPLYGQGIFNGEPLGHSNLSAPNAFVLQRTIFPWEELTVTWNTQPAVDKAVSVSQPSSKAPTDNYLQIDVTPLVTAALAAGETAASMRLQQEVEVHYGQVTFAAREHTDVALHPVLTVDYMVPAVP